MTSSLITGGPQPDPGVRSLAEVLLGAADRTGGIRSVCLIGLDGLAVWLSYRDLVSDASRVLAGIRGSGARAGDAVVLRLAHQHDLLVAFWACMLGGFVAMPVSDADVELDDEVWASLVRPRIVTDLDHLRGEPDHDWSAGAGDDPAVLLRTAGSTGTSKIVVLSHRNILSRSASTVAVNEMSAASRTLNWMPLDHVGGLVMFHLRDTFLGCTQVHATKQWILADPLRWLDVIDRHRVDTTWATNSSYDLVAERVRAGATGEWDLGCLRYVMNGGEPVRAASILRFLDVFAGFGLSGDAMRPGWGMSETSSGVVDFRLDPAGLRAGDRFVPVGVPHPGVSVRVVDERDQPLPPGGIGHLQVTGAPVTLGYQGGPDRRAFTADGWFRTGDLAFVADGVLTVTGSADDAIVVDGTTWHGHEIENVIARLPFVARRCVVAVAVAGELVVFCHLPASVEVGEATELVRDIVFRHCQLPVAHVIPLAEQDFPRTRTGKPMRAALRERFAVQTTGRQP